MARKGKKQQDTTEVVTDEVPASTDSDGVAEDAPMQEVTGDGQVSAALPVEKAKKKKKKKGKADADAVSPRYTKKGKLERKYYEMEELRLQEELVKLQYWVKEKGLRVVIVFEGRDAAGKGGVIKRIIERTNPRIIRVVALGIPTEREKSQWYFQRWVAHLPSAGEIVLFDRSWYTRAVTEYVHGFCTEAEYSDFLRSCPQFERMLIRSGTILLKYWFSVSDEEQERRFQQRASDPRRRWKLSPMDLKSREKWEEYSKAKDRMFDYTDIKQAPWYVVNADDKRRARLNCISHILNQIPYEDILPEPIKLTPRAPGTGYVRPPIEDQTFVPEIY
jgi:polyphosphate kinase 2